MRLEVFSTINGDFYKEKNVFTFVDVSDIVFDKRFCYFTVKQVVESIIKNSKICLKGRKNRSEVRGGGRKPWKQKGTGKARAGSIRSPLWRGGGCAFVPSNILSKKKKINKKMSKFVLCSIFSELIRQKRFVIFHDFILDTCKTSKFSRMLSTLFFGVKKVTFILDSVNDFLKRSSSNLSNVKILTIKSLDVLRIVNSEVVICTVSSLRNLEKFLL